MTVLWSHLAQLKHFKAQLKCNKSQSYCSLSTWHHRCHHSAHHLGGVWTPPPTLHTHSTRAWWSKPWLLALVEYHWAHSGTAVLHNHLTGCIVGISTVNSTNCMGTTNKWLRHLLDSPVPEWSLVQVRHAQNSDLVIWYLQFNHLTIAHESGRIWGPGTIHCYSIWCTICPHPPSWNKPWGTHEEYLCTTQCALVWINEAIPRTSRHSTVDWKKGFDVNSRSSLTWEDKNRS